MVHYIRHTSLLSTHIAKSCFPVLFVSGISIITQSHHTLHLFVQTFQISVVSCVVYEGKWLFIYCLILSILKWNIFFSNCYFSMLVLICAISVEGFVLVAPDTHFLLSQPSFLWGLLVEAPQPIGEIYRDFLGARLPLQNRGSPPWQRYSQTWRLSCRSRGGDVCSSSRCSGRMGWTQ